MKLTEVKTVAKSKGVNPVGKTKESLIREIQKTERNRDCFNRGSPDPPREKRGYGLGNRVCAAGPETRRAKLRCSNNRP
jgi:hypothetical protein